jgi:hypothetical protein
MNWIKFTPKIAKSLTKVHLGSYWFLSNLGNQFINHNK